MNPTHVLIKLDQPVRPDDAQDMAEHVVRSSEFPDVEWARPVVFEGFDGSASGALRGSFLLAGEEVKS
jgi:hypothetical protein